MNAVNHLLAEFLKRPLTDAEQKPETTLDFLGLDSLDRMDVTLEVEQRFGFSTEQSPSTLSDLWLLAQGLATKAAAQPARDAGAGVWLLLNQRCLQSPKMRW